MTEPAIRKANICDKAAVLSLYDAVKGAEFCTWNEYYPTELEFDTDLAADCLLVLEQDGKIIGAASAVTQNELDEAALWKCTDAREIARIAIAPEMQGRGLSKMLVAKLLAELAKNGARAVHLSVAKKNIPAQSCYKSLGFETVGECEMYGNSYFLCEKEL